MSVGLHERPPIAWPVEPHSDLEVPIHVAVAGDSSLEDKAPLLVWLAGFGEGRPAVAMAAKKLGEISGLQTVGAVLPFGEVARRATSLQTGFDYLVADAVHHVANHFNDSGRPVYIGGNSRGGGVAVVASNTGPCDALGTLSPLALTNKLLGAGADVRRRDFAWRLGMRSAAQQNPFEAGNVRTGLGVMAELGGIARKGRLFASLDYALSDILADSAASSLRVLQSREVPAAIFGADKDTVFPLAEYRQVLGEIGCEKMLHEVPGPHACIENRNGQRQMAIVGGWFAQVRENLLGANDA